MSFGIMMQDSDVKNIDVLTLLPQRPPFVMIDRLTHYDEVVTTTCFTVREDNIFLEEDGVLNPCALVENIAQTCAARMGYINLHVHGEHVKLGFIGSVKRLQVIRPARQGEVLTTSIEVTQEMMQLTMVFAEVKVGDEIIATGEMRIAETDIDAIN